MSAVCRCTSSVAGSEIGGRRQAGRLLRYPLRRLRDLRPGHLGMLVHRAEPGEGLLDHDAFGVGQERVRLGGGLPVPGDQPDRDPAGQRDQGVDAALADPDPVQRDVRDHRRVVGVRQHRALAGDRPVVAHHEHDVRAGLQALHHVQRLVPPGHVGRLPVQQLRVQVVHRPVRVVADDLGGAGRQRPVDGRVDLAEQQPPALLVGPAGRAALGPVDDPGHALHVEGDEDLHPERAWRVPCRPPAPPRRVPMPARRRARPRLLSGLLDGQPDLRGNPGLVLGRALRLGHGHVPGEREHDPDRHRADRGHEPRPAPPRTGSLLRTDRERTRISQPG